MSANIVVPSDITILEEKMSIGRRKLGILEQTGLLGIVPMLHLRYSKMDRNDMRSVLSKKYDADDKSEVVGILKKRQESVSKRVVGQNFLWGGGWTFAGFTWWSFRRYNYQSRLIAMPFLFYAGTWFGRYVGDIATGRNAEFARDRFLGQLPARVHFSASS